MGKWLNINPPTERPHRCLTPHVEPYGPVGLGSRWQCECGDTYILVKGRKGHWLWGNVKYWV